MRPDFLLYATMAVCLLGIAAVALYLRVTLGKLRRVVDAQLDHLEASSSRALHEEMARNREEFALSARAQRTETGESIARLSSGLVQTIDKLGSLQKGQLDSFVKQLARLTETNEKRLELLRTTVEKKLTELQTDNAERLEQMRRTVDEKLQSTLEKRLGASFQLVSERLELVHKGLGEMQSLASGVGDLKRVLSNVKMRGTWGEVQLESLLEQILSPEQYERNVATRENAATRVEFCVRLPGRSDNGDEIVWLPIDAKFPLEDYNRLVDAQDRGDADAVAGAVKQLETRIRAAAIDIHDKYLNPPRTTDFAIMFLPTEGLFAEVIRRTELIDTLQRDHRVVVAGPTTLGALLNSLQMGFRTLAIEKRSSEVWKLLAAVKSEFGKFGGVLDKVKKKLEEASNHIESTKVRSRAIERRLLSVQQLPVLESKDLLAEGYDSDGQTAAEGASAEADPGDGDAADETEERSLER